MSSLQNALEQTNFSFTNQTGFYRGKVRDVYEIGNKYLVLIATDRISAFDHILPKPIPGKGAILNTIAAHFLNLTKEIVPNWLVSVPDARVSIGHKCETFPVEMVIRGYLCGHALREYKLGKREICGVKMPDEMKPYEPFPEPIITPTTKAHNGHDEDISREEIISRGLVKEEDYIQLENYTRKLFLEGSIYAKSRGLILADTKYEFGRRDGKIMLIDEVHTPDSSRYFYADGFDKHISDGTTPKQLSKEFVREWLMENGFQGLEGQQIPEMTGEVIDKILNRYIELFELITGKKFEIKSADNTTEGLQQKIENALKELF